MKSLLQGPTYHDQMFFFVFFAGHNCYIRATTVYIVVLVAASQGHRQVEPPSCKLVRKAPLINLLLAIESFK